MNADPLTDKVKVRIPAKALAAVFDECDKYDVDETGGRLLGTYATGSDGHLEIRVRGVIPPGPKTRRSATSLFQDGEFQTKVFREIEKKHPEVEHLGSWHTHHVNGYPTLSAGDRQTYNRTVNHGLHNTRFFYALLVVSRGDADDPSGRYRVRHFIVYRNDEAVYEIPPEAVRVTKGALWLPGKEPSKKRKKKTGTHSERTLDEATERAIDQRFLKEFFPNLRPFLSSGNETVYWKGPIDLIDGTEVIAVIAEVDENDTAGYAVRLRETREELAGTIEESRKARFGSVRAAVFDVQRILNERLYGAALGGYMHPYFMF